MYKKILFMILLSPSVILTSNLHDEKLKEFQTEEKYYSELENVKKEKLRELKAAQEKHKSECEKAIADVTVVSYVWAGLPLALEGLSFIIDFLNLPDPGFTFPIANLCLTAYAINKAANGFRHLIDPDHPKPEDKGQ